MTQTQFSITF